MMKLRSAMWWTLTWSLTAIERSLLHQVRSCAQVLRPEGGGWSLGIQADHGLSLGADLERHSKSRFERSGWRSSQQSWHPVCSTWRMPQSQSPHGCVGISTPRSASTWISLFSSGAGHFDQAPHLPAHCLKPVWFKRIGLVYCLFADWEEPGVTPPMGDWCERTAPKFGRFRGRFASHLEGFLWFNHCPSSWTMAGHWQEAPRDRWSQDSWWPLCLDLAGGWPQDWWAPCCWLHGWSRGWLQPSWRQCFSYTWRTAKAKIDGFYRWGTIKKGEYRCVGSDIQRKSDAQGKYIEIIAHRNHWEFSDRFVSFWPTRAADATGRSCKMQSFVGRSSVGSSANPACARCNLLLSDLARAPQDEGCPRDSVCHQWSSQESFTFDFSSHRFSWSLESNGFCVHGWSFPQQSAWGLLYWWSCDLGWWTRTFTRSPTPYEPHLLANMEASACGRQLQWCRSSSYGGGRIVLLLPTSLGWVEWCWSESWFRFLGSRCEMCPTNQGHCNRFEGRLRCYHSAGRASMLGLSNVCAAIQAFQLKSFCRDNGAVLIWLAGDWLLADALTKKKEECRKILQQFLSKGVRMLQYNPGFETSARKSKKAGLDAASRIQDLTDFNVKMWIDWEDFCARATATCQSLSTCARSFDDVHGRLWACGKTSRHGFVLGRVRPWDFWFCGEPSNIDHWHFPSTSSHYDLWFTEHPFPVSAVAAESLKTNPYSGMIEGYWTLLRYTGTP